MFKKFIILVLAAVLITISTPIVSNHFSNVMAQDAATSGRLDSAGFMFNLSPITHEGITGSTKQGFIREGVNYFFTKTIAFMAGTIAGLAVLMMMVGGLMIMTSGGNEERRTKGANFIKYAAMGLVFALGAYVIVTAVQLLVASIYA